MANNYDQIIKNILRDIQVEMTDEFDRNFERQAFFSEAWQRRKSPTRPGGHILVDTGGLRRSIRSYETENSIVFRTEHPAAAIHNEGGEIKVTAKMKRFFWHKYYDTSGSFGRRKDGSLRKDKRTVQLSTEAEFWKFMALMKVGTKIRIPRRRFLGTAPEVEQTVRQIIEENLTEFFNTDFDIIER
ncbi:phage virion morphogenesis protein [uncultured Muribaculum sp.]|jgi:phage gpG-like protein|uniref:phage virion morphogenesis protein n=1 Tax=uncultured Muribaculum sp. TaxID=1918613 RepID=UPI000FFE4B7D|nr:phage virion morphogenesis protein [uncultured Muribaculum sp.]RXE74696.1 phage morphogenesis protein [Muribaculaceae bacterium Isolate-013 (NCI)]